MTERSGSSGTDSTAILAALREKAASEAGGSPTRRVAALREAARELLAKAPAGERARILREMKEAVGTRPPSAGPATAGGVPDPALRAEAARAREEASQARAERDALLRENQKLRAAAAARGPGGAPTVSADSLETFREGLRGTLAGKKITVESLGLPPEDARTFRLMQELVSFLTNVEMAKIHLLNAVDVGPAGAMDTRILGKYKQRVRKELLSVLDDQEGSVKRLQKTLEGQNKFLYGLNEAFQSSFPAGSRSLLDELDPEPILEAARGRIMTNYEQAWKTFERRYQDLGNLTPAELWERFFRDPFQKKLSEWLDEGDV